jgi:hypothetical protein
MPRVWLRENDQSQVFLCDWLGWQFSIMNGSIINYEWLAATGSITNEELRITNCLQQREMAKKAPRCKRATQGGKVCHCLEP